MGFSIFAQKPAETPLREWEMLMRGEDLSITQMRRKYITVHPKVQFSLRLSLCFSEPSAELDISVVVSTKKHC